MGWDGMGCDWFIESSWIELASKCAALDYQFGYSTCLSCSVHLRLGVEVWDGRIWHVSSKSAWFLLSSE